MLAYN